MAYGAASSTGKPLTLRDKLTRRYAAMKQERSSWDEHVRDVFTLTRPRRTRFTVTDVNRGDRRNQKVIDNTGIIASRVLRSALTNGLSDPTQEWFKYEPEDLAMMEYGPVKSWVGMLTNLVRRIFAESNVYEALPTIYDELGLAGTGVGVIEDDFDTVIRLKTFTWGEYCLAVNGRGIVDTLYRECRMTVYQVVDTFGLENVSTNVRSLYERCQYDDWVTVMHAIEPNLDRDPRKNDAKNMAWRSIYWEADCRDPADKDKFLRRSGYRNNPIIAPRWDVVGNDVYGSTSPGMEALGDMRQLQIQQKRKGEAIDKLVRPPTQGPASLADKFVNTLPGAHTTVSNMAEGGVKPLFEVRPDVGALNEDIEDTRQRVNEAFYVPYILSISQIEGVQPRNQWEISERKGEGLMVLGPVVQRLQNELFEPLHARVIERIYDVCIPLWQMGEPAMLPPPPPELQGMPIRVKYVSPFAKMQQAAGVAAIERLVTMVANVAEIFPAMRRKLDEEQIVDVLGDKLSVAPGVVRPDDEVAAIAEAEAQQAQMQQLAAMAQPMKDAAQAAKALGETNIGGGQGAMEALLDAGRQQAAQDAAA